MKTKTFLPWIILTTTLLFCGSQKLFAERGVPLWTNLNGGKVMAVDSNGNVFVAGYDSFGSGTFGTFAYSSSGVALWTNSYQGTGDHSEIANGIGVDSSGNVFVAGTSLRSDFQNDYTTVKYSSAGMPIWTNHYNGSGNGDDYAVALAVDKFGNAIVTGYSYNGNGYNYATIMYSGAGVPLWTNLFTGLRNDFSSHASAIAVDTNGSVFVTGYSEGASFGEYDYATIKYSGAGVAAWTNRYNAHGFFDQAEAIAVDNSGNAVVTGFTGSSGSGLGNDYATVKYSNAGAPLWAKSYSGTPGNSDDVAYAVAVDSNGNAFVTGQNVSSGDCPTIKYSSTGAPLWTNHVFMGGSSIAADSNGNVFVTGGNGTIAYSGAGVPLWTNTFYGGSAVSLDSKGNVIVTGGGFTVKFSSSIPGPPHLDFQWVNNRLVLNWTNTGFTLQSAPDLASTFTNIPNATSPFTNPPSAAQQFFRLSSP